MGYFVEGFGEVEYDAVYLSGVSSVKGLRDVMMSDDELRFA